MAEVLEDWLKRKFPQAKRATLREMLREGRVVLRGKPLRRLDAQIEKTDAVEVRSREPVRLPNVRPLEIVFEDAHLIVVYKPAGLLTSTVPHEKRATALAILEKYMAVKDRRAKVGLIHRLDRDASGLLVFSKSHEAFAELKEQFFQHTVARVYAAVTQGVPTPASGRIESMLVELPDGSVRTSHRPGGGQKAITDYQTIARGKGIALVRVTLQTGRKHQIRAHMQQRGVPIVGDPIYGDEFQPGARLMLAAVELGFDHPISGKKVEFKIPVPKDFPIGGGEELKAE